MHESSGFNNYFGWSLVDIGDAYAWARQTLPSLTVDAFRSSPRRELVYRQHVSHVSGLDLCAASTPPPEAILAFYCLTNYEDEFWQEPNTLEHYAI